MTLKQGDTFAFFLDLKTPEGLPIVVPVESMKCQARDEAYSLLEELIVSETDEPGTYLFQTISTMDWPIGRVRYDVKININGRVITTETTTLEVIKEVTRYG